MGGASSIVKAVIGSSNGGLIGNNMKLLKLISSASSSSVSAMIHKVPSTLLNNSEIHDDMKKVVPLEIKLMSIRDLAVGEQKGSLKFHNLVDKHGDKDFLEKFQILEEIERKIFCRMLMVEYVPDEYHQLDEIVDLQEIISLDNPSSAPIHMVCEKLRKFVCNYQTSYERWLEILSSLQDELLMQLIGDYDEYMGIKDTSAVTNKQKDIFSPKVLLHNNNEDKPTCTIGCTTRVPSFADNGVVLA